MNMTHNDTVTKRYKVYLLKTAAKEKSIETQNAITISPAGGAAGLHEFDRERYEGAASGAPTITIKSLLTPVQQTGVPAYGVGTILSTVRALGIGSTLNQKSSQSPVGPIRYASPERPVQQRYQSTDPRLLPDPKFVGNASPFAPSRSRPSNANATPEHLQSSHPATPNTPITSRTPLGVGRTIDALDALADEEQHVSRRVRRRERANLKGTPPLSHSSVPPGQQSGGGTPNSIRSRSKDSLTHANAAVFTHLVDDPELQPDGPSIPYSLAIPNQQYQQQQQLSQPQSTTPTQQPPPLDLMRQYVQQPLLNRNQSPQTKIRATSLEAELNGAPVYAKRNGLVNGAGGGIYRAKNYGNLAHAGEHFDTVYDTLPPPTVRTSTGMGQIPGSTPGIGPDHVGGVRMLEKGNSNVRNLETLVRRFESAPGESGFLNERQFRSQLALGSGESPPSKYSKTSPGLGAGLGPSQSPNASPKFGRRADNQRTTPGTQASQSYAQGMTALVGLESPRDLSPKRGIPGPRREGTLVRSIKGYDGSRFPNNFSNLTSEQRQILISNAYGTGRVTASRGAVAPRLPIGERDREISPLRDSRGGAVGAQLPPASQHGGLSPNVSVFRRAKTNLDLTIDTIGAQFSNAHNPILANAPMLKLDLQGNGIQAPGLVIAARSRATSAAPPHSAVRIEGSQQLPALGLNSEAQTGGLSAHPITYTPYTNSTSNQSNGTANGMGGAGISPSGQPSGILKNLSSVKRSTENVNNNSGSDKENNGAGINGGVTFLHKSASISRSSLRNGKGASTRTLSEDRTGGVLEAQAPEELPRPEESPLDKLNARLRATSQSNLLDEPPAVLISRERAQSRKTKQSSKQLSVSFQISTADANEKDEAAAAAENPGGTLKKHLSSNALDGDLNDPEPELGIDATAAATAATTTTTALASSSDRDREREREQRERERERERKSASRQRRSEEAAGSSSEPEFSPSLLNLIIRGPRCATPEDDFEEEVPSEDTPEKRERVARWLMGLRGVRLDTPPVQETIETPTSVTLLPEDTYIQSASRSNSFVQQLPAAQESVELRKKSSGPRSHHAAQPTPLNASQDTRPANYLVSKV